MKGQDKREEIRSVEARERDEDCRRKGEYSRVVSRMRKKRAWFEQHEREKREWFEQIKSSLPSLDSVSAESTEKRDCRN